MSKKDSDEDTDSKILMFTLKFLREHEQTMDDLGVKIDYAKSNLSTNIEKMSSQIDRINKKVQVLENEIARIKEETLE
jgi:peptidoglycan hydrolase CwlO-like protein